MKRMLASLVSALALAATAAIPAATDPVVHSETAGLTVVETIDFTIVDYGANGINFGSLSPGGRSWDEAVTFLSSGFPQEPSVRLTIGAGTNVPVTVSVSGSGDFTSGTNTIPLASACAHNTIPCPAGWNMSTTPIVLGNWTPATGYWSLGVYHWLEVPSNAVGGTYTTTFYYKAERTP